MALVLLQQWMEHPELLNKETLSGLRELVDRYPYFQSARLLYLKNLYLLHDASWGEELRKAALCVADRRILFHLTAGESYALHSCTSASTLSDKMEEPSVDRTLALIDAFLANSPEEQRTVQQPMDLDYTVDYTAYLLQEDADAAAEGADTEVPQLRGHELIDDFIQQKAEGFSEMKENAKDEKVSGPGWVAGEDSDEALDESYFTETLAKIYIKQHRYEKALEIIKKLSLNYPKKNAYFADQIRFLEKLIINAKSK